MKSNLHVLVVDDEPMLLRLLTEILKREEYHVMTAENVAAARSILESSRCDIIVSDISMPGESGYDLLRFAKEHHPDTGVILMTGHGDMYSVKDAMLLGADEYINKPFKGFEIAVMVERVYWRLRSSGTHNAGASVSQNPG